jgi:hypothetical protein
LKGNLEVDSSHLLYHLVYYKGNQEVDSAHKVTRMWTPDGNQEVDSGGPNCNSPKVIALFSGAVTGRFHSTTTLLLESSKGGGVYSGLNTESWMTYPITSAIFTTLISIFSL